MTLEKHLLERAVATLVPNLSMCNLNVQYYSATWVWQINSLYQSKYFHWDYSWSKHYLLAKYISSYFNMTAHCRIVVCRPNLVFIFAKRYEREQWLCDRGHKMCIIHKDIFMLSYLYISFILHRSSDVKAYKFKYNHKIKNTKFLTSYLRNTFESIVNLTNDLLR